MKKETYAAPRRARSTKLSIVRVATNGRMVLASTTGRSGRWITNKIDFNSAISGPEVAGHEEEIDLDVTELMSGREKGTF